MPTIRQLLDRYGQPPQELALDWAWQLRAHLERSPSHTTTCLLQHRVWTDLELTAEGLLVCADLDCQSATEALEDLRHWAAPNHSADSSPFTMGEPSSREQTIPLDSSAQPGDGLSHRLNHRQQLFHGKLFHGKLFHGKLFGGKLTWSVVAACGLAILAVVCVSNSDNTSLDMNHSTTGELTSRELTRSASQLLDSPDLGPSAAPLQLETLSLVEPSPQDAADGSTSSTETGALTQLNVETSITPDSVQPAGADQPDNNAPPSLASAGLSPTSDTTSDQAATNQPSAEALSDVKHMLQQAEAEESVGTANRNRAGLQDTHGDPWILSRDTMRYRVTLAPELKQQARDAHWSLALEPIAGLAVQPERPVTIQPRGLAVWRIYEADAKPPRSCLFVRAVHRGRDGQLELYFCGGAEDMPGMSVPLASKWIEPLTIRVQSQALELRGALARLSTTVITPDQVPAAMQRKQALLAQMFTSTRLSVIMPEINRLAQLVDGQVTMHAALRSQPDESPLATWGHVP